MDGVAEFIQDIKILQHAIIGIVLLVTDFTTVNDRIAQWSNADLQSTPIGDQGAGIEADHMIDGADRHVGWREQRWIIRFVIDHHIKAVFLDQGIVFHER